MVEQGQRALKLARTTGSDLCVASAEMVLGSERLCVGAIGAAEEYFARAVPIMKSEGTPTQALDAASSAGMIHTWRLEYHEAQRIFDWSLQRSHELGDCLSHAQDSLVQEHGPGESGPPVGRDGRAQRRYSTGGA